jgi:hypothetical protein
MAKLKGGTRIYGEIKIDGGIRDSSNQIGIGGSVLISTGVGIAWTTSAGGGGGAQGIQGVQGLQGTQGSQGLQGVQGSQGIQNAQGTQGLQGVQGSQGIQNTQGIQGLQGVQGLSNQGAQGIQNTQGIQGLQGVQGSQGIQNTQGTQGTQGLQGVQGTQGLQGRQGAQGLQGVQGSQGLQSAQGVQGPSGSGAASTSITAYNTTAVTTLYPVMVSETGSATTAYVRSTATALSFNASTNILSASEVDITASGSANNSVLSLTGTPTSASGTNGLLGIGALSFSDTDIIANFTHNVNSYAQLVVQNKNSGSTSSTDIIVNNDRAAGTTYYGDFGINGTTFAGGGVFGDVDGTYLYSAGGTLSLGSLNSYDVKIATNSTERVRVSTGGSVGIGTTNPTQTLHVQGNVRITGSITDSTGSTGSSPQVLQSTTNGIVWATASASGGGGSGKFDTTIENVLYVQPTGTLDIVGVGTTTTQITTLPASPPEYIIHSMHVTNISNGDAEITAGFVMNARKVPASISVSVGSSGGPGIHTFTVGSASSITVGMAVTGTGNIGETTGIGSTAGFQFNTYVTSVDGNNITLSKPMSGRATGVLYFSPVSKLSSRLPVPVGSAVELLKQPMILNALDSIVLQSTGAGTGIGTTSTNTITYTSGSSVLTVTNQAASFFNSIAIGNLVQNTGASGGIQTNTYVGASYTGITTSYAGTGVVSIPITRPVNATVGVATALSFTEVVTPQDGALQVTVVYQSSTDTSYQNGTGTVVGIVTLPSQATPPILGITSTTPLVYYSTGNVYPSIIQSIRVSNISDSIIYPGGDYPVSVGIGNSDTIFSWLAYNMVIPRNSSIELCEAPKRIGIGQSIFAFSNTPNAIEIQIAGKQKTS